ncbi:MAG: hypothetical protein K0R29_456 [Pseudobdellovibrio sp.]|jgi:hypothetical protein|nr:hypothetical protein [Pseudobdellovibrio sp.]
MRLELEILDGVNKGKKIPLRNGLIVGKTVDSLTFDDDSMADLHAILNLDSNKRWNIECLGDNKLRLGFEEVPKARLIVGLVFNLGQTGFKVVQKEGRAIASWENEMKAWLENHPGPRVHPDMFFFLKPIRLSFIQGPQYEEVYTLSYGPREIGFNNLDLNIKDPAVPPKVAKFFQVADKVYIENLCGEKATLNGNAFDQHLVSSGDKLKVGSNVIELSLL